MDCPWNASVLCMFNGCVNYYQDMWPNHVHILKSLTDHSWLKGMLQYLEPQTYKQHSIRCVLVLYKKANQLLIFPLSKTQQKYMAMVKEMLSIAATLNKF
ncbi:LOW QUALITY PROTEIN: hypothetical protein ACHAW6_009091 [Cyclotella cf. meneghiniana]